MGKLGLPWWRSGWESACQCKGHGFEPWSGKIPHAAEELSLWATTTEPVRLEPVLRNKRGCDSERPTHRDEEWPLLAITGESPRTEMKKSNTAKNKKIINKWGNYRTLKLLRHYTSFTSPTSSQDTDTETQGSERTFKDRRSRNRCIED